MLVSTFQSTKAMPAISRPARAKTAVRLPFERYSNIYFGAWLLAAFPAALYSTVKTLNGAGLNALTAMLRIDERVELAER